MSSNSSSGAVHPSIRFARMVLTAAGTFGLIQVLPLYFAESALNRMAPPALTHPEFYYGFVGIVVAWQIAFLIMSRDPLRYRTLFPALFVEKLLWPAAVYTLYAGGRLAAPSTLVAGALDLVWLALFIIAWARLGAYGRSPEVRGRGFVGATLVR